MTSFGERLVEANQPVWAAMAAHPFVLALAGGTLPEAPLRAWLQQDRLFVLEERRAVAALRAHGLPAELDRLLAGLEGSMAAEAEAFAEAAERHGFAVEAERWPAAPRPRWPPGWRRYSAGRPGSSWPSGRCAGAGRRGRAERAAVRRRPAGAGAPARPPDRPRDRRRHPPGGALPRLAGPGLPVPARLRAAVRAGRRAGARHRRARAPGRPGPRDLPRGAVPAPLLRGRVRPGRRRPGRRREVNGVRR